MKRAAKITAAALILAMAPLLPIEQLRGEGADALSLVRPALAEEGWKAEFDEVCGKSDDSMNLSQDELKALMARCDRLKPLIEAQEETVRKVYLKRLQMCRDLLAYVHEVKSRN
ncbi:MAG: hypothetical protein NDI77_17765 [Geobacteraceae bacterium]|nr:hypothetical protein [Geobacteraceae bacterium]